MSNAFFPLSSAAVHAEQRLPAFVRQRMDEHYVERIEKLLGGEHLHEWQAMPARAVMLAGNDYLNIAGEARLLAAQAQVLQGGGAMLMSSVFLQEGSRQHRLEQKCADFLGSEACVLAQSGWAANVGLLQSLAGPGIPVYLDMQAHASLWEGVQSAQAVPVAFLHNDGAHLQRQLDKHGPGIIVVDALYSTNGSVAPLLQMVEIAERSGSMLIVDESHSLGTHGPQGAGLITCSARFKGYFLSASRPAIFSSCLLEHELAWFDAALDFIRAADARRAALRRHSVQLRQGLADLGYNVSDGTEQIIALEAGSEPDTLILRKALERHGIYGAVFCAPATPKNRSLVRLTLNAGLREDECARVLAACAAIRDETGMARWPSTRRLRKLALV